MPFKLLLESVVTIVALVCFAVAAKAFIEVKRLNRVLKHQAALEAMPQSEESLRRAG